MNKATIWRRYAMALLMIAREQNKIEYYRRELEDMLLIVQANGKLKTTLEMMELQPAYKKQVLKKYLGGKFSDITWNFINLVVDKKREAYLEGIIQAYSRYADQAGNVIEAEVRSAVELTRKDYRDLQKRLAKVTGKNIRLKTVVDPSILGGLIVKIGETVMDGSVTKRLDQLRKRLQESLV